MVQTKTPQNMTYLEWLIMSLNCNQMCLGIGSALDDVIMMVVDKDRPQVGPQVLVVIVQQNSST